LAAQAPVSDGLIIPMIDARRMEVYSDIYSELESKRETRAEIIDEDSFEN
jgi:tRNA threonylcarbamoyladenosine biosynthesis protein TsaB